MIMHWPQWTLFVLILLEIGIHIGKDGQPRGDYSGLGKLADAAIFFGLLWYGGFWTGGQ